MAEVKTITYLPPVAAKHYKLCADILHEFKFIRGNMYNISYNGYRDSKSWRIMFESFDKFEDIETMNYGPRIPFVSRKNIDIFSNYIEAVIPKTFELANASVIKFFIPNFGMKHLWCIDFIQIKFIPDPEDVENEIALKLSAQYIHQKINVESENSNYKEEEEEGKRKPTANEKKETDTTSEF